ncbi:hypothetical protein EKK58_03735 [Candidatus Dependentiae bacterium]|nr:MAG: hypothetical protein EKK58_03735 [Candidatus Dependentiae bacterium]
MLAKTIAFSAVLLLGTYNISTPYSISIKNESPNAVKITMVYAGGSAICPNAELEIKSGETRSVESGACCTSYVSIYGLEGTVKNKTFTYQPPVTGFGIACRGFSFVIKQTADGALVGTTI